MPKPLPRPTFGQIYRQQYRQASSGKTSRAFRIISPVVLLIVAVFVHSLVVSIILGGLAVLLLTVAVIWTVNQRHRAVGAAMSAAESRTTRGTDRRARRARLHADI